MINIALIGLGSAGRSRLQALEQNSHFKLAGIVSRRPDTRTISLEEVMSRSEIEAIAISTENTLHETYTEMALKAGKHVLCDYPLAFSGEHADFLYSLARSQQKVLHIEHIGLLTQAHQKAKKKLATMGKCLSGKILFTASWNEKLANPNYTGPLPFLAISRLFQMADLLGSFEITDHQFVCNSDIYDLTIHIKLKDGGQIEFRELRQKELPRKRTFDLQMKQGNFTLEASIGNEKLFAQDLQWFYERIMHNKPCYYDEELLIHTTKMLQSIPSI